MKALKDSGKKYNGHFRSEEQANFVRNFCVENSIMLSGFMADASQDMVVKMMASQQIADELDEK